MFSYIYGIGIRRKKIKFKILATEVALLLRFSLDSYSIYIREPLLLSAVKKLWFLMFSTHPTAQGWGHTGLWRFGGPAGFTWVDAEVLDLVWWYYDNLWCEISCSSKSNIFQNVLWAIILNMCLRWPSSFHVMRIFFLLKTGHRIHIINMTLVCLRNIL